MVILSGKDDYYSFEARESLAKSLCYMHHGRDVSKVFSPYMPNGGDSSFWTYDQGNDWKVKFFDESPRSFGIIYRYDSDKGQQEMALAGWLCVRLGMEISGRDWPATLKP